MTLSPDHPSHHLITLFGKSADDVARGRDVLLPAFSCLTPPEEAPKRDETLASFGYTHSLSLHFAQDASYAVASGMTDEISRILFQSGFAGGSAHDPKRAKRSGDNGVFARRVFC